MLSAHGATILLGVWTWHIEERSEVPLFPFKQLYLGSGMLRLRLWHRTAALPDFAHAATAAAWQPLPQTRPQGALPPHLDISLSSCRVWLQLLLCPRKYSVNEIFLSLPQPSFSCSFLFFLPMNHDCLYLWVTVEVAWHTCVVQHDQTDGHITACVYLLWWRALNFIYRSTHLITRTISPHLLQTLFSLFFKQVWGDMIFRHLSCRISDAKIFFSFPLTCGVPSKCLILRNIRVRPPPSLNGSSAFSPLSCVLHVLWIITFY